ACARTIIDHDLLLERDSQFLADHAGYRIVAAARELRPNDAHRFARVALCERRSGSQGTTDYDHCSYIGQSHHGELSVKLFDLSHFAGDRPRISEAGNVD